MLCTGSGQISTQHLNRVVESVENSACFPGIPAPIPTSTKSCFRFSKTCTALTSNAGVVSARNSTFPRQTATATGKYPLKKLFSRSRRGRPFSARA